MKTAVLSLLIFLAISFHFHSLLQFPFVLDDWLHIHEFIFIPQTFDNALRSSFPLGYFFRPFWFLSLFSLYKILGENYSAYHAVFILFHVVHCLLLVRVFILLGTGRWTAWSVAFLYAFARIHEMTILWPTATHIVGGWLFLLLSFERYLKKRMRSSALLFMISILFKEGTIAFPLLFMFHHALTNGKPKPRTFLSLWPFVIPLAIYAALRVPSLDSLHFPQLSGYHVDPLSVPKNLLVFNALSCESIFLFKDFPLTRTNVLISTAVLTLFILAGYLARPRNDTASLKIFPLLILWYLVGLLPVLSFNGVRSDFWLTYSLPAAAALVVISAKHLLERTVGRDLGRAALAAMIAADLLAAHSDLLRRERRALSGELSQRADLMVPAASVGMTWKDLLEKLPRVPPYSTLLFDGVDVFAFMRDRGPQVWYGDRTIDAYDLNYLKIKGSEAVIEGHRRDILHFINGAILPPVTLKADSTYVISTSPEGVRVNGLRDVVDADGRLVLRHLKDYELGGTVDRIWSGRAFFSNFDAWEGDFRWTQGKDAAIYIRLGDKVDIRNGCTLEVHARSLGEQTSHILINGQKIGTIFFSGRSQETKRLLFDGATLKPGDINSIEFVIPGARATDKDARILGIKLYSLRILPGERPLPAS